MNHTQKIISKLPLVQLCGLEWTVDTQSVYIQEYNFTIISGDYELLVVAYLELVGEKIYCVPNYIEVSENTSNGWAMIDITDADHEAIARAINDVIQ